MKPAASLLVRHARELLTMNGPPPARDAKGAWDEAPLGCIADGAVALHEGAVVAVGRSDEVERSIALTGDATVIDARDELVAPGLVDAHTHSLFVGDRSNEYGMRVRGATYAEIAAQGGGIASSVRALRSADDGALHAVLRDRVARMRAFGVTTVEVKTGYALDTAHELRCLDAMARVPGVIPTWLPFHAVPPELRGVTDGRARYLRAVRDEMLPAVLAQGVARFVDAYLDGPGFQVDEVRAVIAEAQRAGLGVRLHVGQFEDVGGAEYAAEIGAASVDHLEHVSDAGLRAMAAAKVTAVLLPGAAFSLGQPMPDARRMRALGVEVALATDCNPGTSFTENLPLMASFAVRQMGLSTVEAWWALTRVAARSLGCESRAVIAPGHRASVVRYAMPSWASLPYEFGAPRAVAVVADDARALARIG